jgi:ATP-binding cassette subfamily B protein
MPGKCSDRLGPCKLSRTKAAAPGFTDLLWKRRLPLRARLSLARAALTGFAILVIGSSIVAVLWIGASDVFAGRMTGGELSQFLLYSILAAGSLAALSEVWGELSQAAGAAERLSELLEITPEIRAPLNPIPLPDTPRGEIRFEDVSFAYQAAGNLPVVQDLTLTIAPGRKSRSSGPQAPAKARYSVC